MQDKGFNFIIYPQKIIILGTLLATNIYFPFFCENFTITKYFNWILKDLSVWVNIFFQIFVLQNLMIEVC